MASSRKERAPGRASSPHSAAKASAPHRPTAAQEKSEHKTNTPRRREPAATQPAPAPARKAAARSEGTSPRTAGEPVCPVRARCGGCDYQGVPYAEQLKKKEMYVRGLLAPFCPDIRPIIGMDDPWHYRCKVHAVFAPGRKGEAISGIYEKGTHRVVRVDECLIEDQLSARIIVTIRSLLPSFRIRPYDEDTGCGLLRHVLIRRGYATGQLMVVLVTASPVFPSRNNFVRKLRELHPQITTIVQNINERGTSMVLGERNVTLYGPGYIEDKLLGCTFRISPNAFYQVNPRQTEVLYRCALEMADVTPKSTVLDAYCGTGTIGLIAARTAGVVYGVELNRDAVRDAIVNAKKNKIDNIRFINADAEAFMKQAATGAAAAARAAGAPGIGDIDLVIMDPPRSGATEGFLDALGRLAPARAVYVSCNPETLARDLRSLQKKGYRALKARIVDMFPHSRHVECVVLLSR